MAKAIRYKISAMREPDFEDVGSCVYKLSWGRGFCIIKAKNLYVSLNMFKKSLNQYSKGSPAQHKPTNLYAKFFKYIVSHPDNSFKVQVLVNSDSGYKLLRAEQHFIKKSKKNKYCMNSRRGAYIPQWNPLAINPKTGREFVLKKL